MHILDLSNPRDIVKFAEEFVQSRKSLDVLVSGDMGRGVPYRGVSSDVAVDKNLILLKLMCVGE